MGDRIRSSEQKCMKQSSLGLYVDFWDETMVGAFEPEKCVNRVRDAFENVTVDPTDHQEVRLTREIDHWNATVSDRTLRDTLILQSKRLYRGNGPTYRFVIKFEDGHEVNGTARRLSFTFWFDPSLSTDIVSRLRKFLLSISLGSPTIEDIDEQSDGHEVLDHPI